LLPHLEEDDVFVNPLARVSEQRRRATHKIRPPAQPFDAFRTFAADLDSSLNAIRLLRTTLEQELSMDAKRSKDRQDALKWLPIIVKAPEPNYSINRARQMEGKTIEKVEVGFREERERVHQSEGIVVHFTDGSIMSINVDRYWEQCWPFTG
jgi:hypothetical protein